MNISKNSIIATAIASAALVLSVFLLAGGLKGFRSHSSKSLSVTGKAEHTFTSDIIVWEGKLSSEALRLADAYADLRQKQTAVQSYLKAKNIPDSIVTFSSVSIDKMNEYEYVNGQSVRTFKGYRLTQEFVLSSRDVVAVEVVSRQISELINQGIEIESQAPRYYYSKLNELKLQLLEAAAEDARKRASVMAKGGESSLGKLQRSNMGVFQVVGELSDEDYSWGGAFNTRSKVKTASITVSSTYSIN